MKYSVRKIAGNRHQINLIPENKEDQNIINNTKDENIDMYYHHAVESCLGKSACLLSIEPGGPDRYSVIGEIEYAGGFGGA